MEKAKKSMLVKMIIGLFLFVTGLVLFIVGFVIERPVVTFQNHDGTYLGKVSVASGHRADDTLVRPLAKKEAGISDEGYVYIFAGWEPSIEKVEDDMTVKAVYNRVPRVYQISYNLNGGVVDEGYATTYTLANDTMLPTPTKFDCTFKGWSDGKNIITKIVKGSTGNKNLTAVWDAPEYTISYELNGGTVQNAIEKYTAEQTITLATPTKEGCVFVGWYESPSFDESTKVTKLDAGKVKGDKTFYARFDYTINYELDGGKMGRLVQKTYNPDLGLELEEITKTGYKFLGWFENDVKLEKIEKGETGDKTLVAKFEKVNEGEVFTELGIDYIYFGSYPQSVVTEQKLIDALSKVITKEDQVVEYEGAKYVKVKATPKINLYEFDSKLESNYTTGAKTDSELRKIRNGKDYFFKVEPIKWRVLSDVDGKLTLISEYTLDTQEFDSKSNNYETSTIRKWLNETFYNKAFNQEEKAKITETTVDNSISSVYGNTNHYVCNNTIDKVYLLSYAEVLKVVYGFGTSYNTEDEQKASFSTEYARAKGVEMATAYANYGNTNWLLRSPYDAQKAISVVKGIPSQTNKDINIVETFASISGDYGVRPVITITK